MAVAKSKQITAAEFFEWLQSREKVGKKYELECGEIIEMPSPGELHGVVCFLIIHLLGNYVFQRKRGYLCTNDTGLLVKTDPDTVRGPDVMLIDELKKIDEISPKYTVHVPKLIVEVLSPTDQPTKTNRRVSQYLQRGVSLVWVVDPEVRSVTVYSPNRSHFVLDETEELTGQDVLADLRIRVADLFVLPG